MTETRKERFRRLATKRTNAVLEKLRLLSNLSNKANYSYTEEEVNKVFRTIERQLRVAKISFKNRKKVQIKL